MFWIWVAVIAVIIVISKCFSLFVFPRILSRWFTLHHELSTEDGYVAVPDLSHLVGKQGVAVTDLKPCGKIRLDDTTYDARVEKGVISRGAKIVVSHAQGNSIIVQPAEI
ncbi:MAG TPA: NfeD family protein [Candidatus Ozemobacteraceae bacterium]|nr:NfeD family protein [Candidatus Ozemobacteraceae bacterium]